VISARPLLDSETRLPQHVEVPRRLIGIDRLKACAILAVVMTARMALGRERARLWLGA